MVTPVDRLRRVLHGQISLRGREDACPGSRFAERLCASAHELKKYLLPEGEAAPFPNARSCSPRRQVEALTEAGPSKGSWPSFRGLDAAGIAEPRPAGQWDGKTAEHPLEDSHPGSRPPVRRVGRSPLRDVRDQQQPGATFSLGSTVMATRRTTLPHKFSSMRSTNGRQNCLGADAFEGRRATSAHQIPYASASPATDGRIVVAWFGSQGSCLRRERPPLWKVISQGRHGRL